MAKKNKSNLDNLVFNLLPSPIDIRDYKLESVIVESPELPEVHDMRPDLMPIRNQGSQGTCSAMTASVLKEWHEKKEANFSDYMSPQFIYNLREDPATPGMTPRDTMKILYKIGAIEEKVYPYNQFQPISEDLKKDAYAFRIQGYAKIESIDGLKEALYKNGPCYIAFPVYNQHNHEFFKKETETQRLLGGHAVAVVGWVEDAFIIRNSWGKTWGDKGYCYYKFTDWGIHWEVWTAIDAKTAADIEENKPKPEPIPEPKPEPIPEPKPEPKPEPEPIKEDSFIMKIIKLIMSIFKKKA